MNNYLIEFIGCFVLVLTVKFTKSPILICTVILGLIYFGRDFSGAFYNPVLTIPSWLWGAITTTQLLGYVAVQLLGCIAGLTLVRLLDTYIL